MNVTDDTRGSVSEETPGPEELEIELIGEPQPTEQASGELLAITAQDIADDSAEVLPPVSELDSALVEGTANWVDISAVCSQTGDGFVVHFQQIGPDRFTYAGAQRRREPQQEPVTGGRNVKGEFDLSDYPGCPVCGAPGLVVCSGCGTVVVGLRCDRPSRDW